MYEIIEREFQAQCLVHGRCFKNITSFLQTLLDHFPVHWNIKNTRQEDKCCNFHRMWISQHFIYNSFSPYYPSYVSFSYCKSGIQWAMKLMHEYLKCKKNQWRKTCLALSFLFFFVIKNWTIISTLPRTCSFVLFC